MSCLNDVFSSDLFFASNSYFVLSYQGQGGWRFLWIKHIFVATMFVAKISLTHLIAVKTCWLIQVEVRVDDLSRHSILALAGCRWAWLPMGPTAGYQ